MPMNPEWNDLVDRTPGQDRPLQPERMDDGKFESAVKALDEQAEGEGDPRYEASDRRLRDLCEAHNSHQQRQVLGSGGQAALASLAQPCGDPVSSLASDLCETVVTEGMPPEDIVATARACRGAAEICYGRTNRRQELGAIDPAFHAEILRQHATMEGIIQRLDSDPGARRRRWGTFGWGAPESRRGDASGSASHD